MQLFSIISFIVILAIFLYFGYINDYKRDKKKFTEVVFFVIGLFSILLIGYLTSIHYSPILEKRISKYYWEIDEKSNLNHSDKIDDTTLFKSYSIKQKVDKTLNTIGTVFIILIGFLISLLGEILKKRYT